MLPQHVREIYQQYLHCGVIKCASLFWPYMPTFCNKINHFIEPQWIKYLKIHMQVIPKKDCKHKHQYTRVMGTNVWSTVKLLQITVQLSSSFLPMHCETAVVNSSMPVHFLMHHQSCQPNLELLHLHQLLQHHLSPHQYYLQTLPTS